MDGKSCIKLVVAVGLVFGSFSASFAEDVLEQPVDNVAMSIDAASVAIDQARAAIENGKQLIAQIPVDSELINEVKKVLLSASSNWDVAVDALESANAVAGKITEADDEEAMADYTLLAKVDSNVALTGALVVQNGLLFVEAVASGKTEALGLIRESMNDAIEGAAGVQENAVLVKQLIAEKYSKEG